MGEFITKIFDLSYSALKETILNPLAIWQDDKDEILTEDNKLGWSVVKAEVTFRNNNNDLHSYTLYSEKGHIQARAEKIQKNNLLYWRYEYLGRETRYSPDNFQPRLSVFLDYIHNKVIKSKELYNKDISLPIVSYELESNNKLKSIRYSLIAENEFTKPLFLLTVDSDEYLHTLSDWQTLENKHTVFPTKKYPDNYLLQDFTGWRKISSYSPIKVKSKLIEKILLFKGFEEYKIKCLVDESLTQQLRRYGFYIHDLLNIITETDILFKYIPTVNYHIVKPCNMHCKHCFSDFSEQTRPYLSFKEAKQIIEKLSEINVFNKLNFSGGEPTLFKGIEELIIYAKKLGFKEVSLVSNGYKIIKFTKEIPVEFFKNLDILALSIDSFNKDINIKIGRYVGKQKETLSLNDFEELKKVCDKYNVRIKINTVVTKLNCSLDLATMISKLKPIRWKILRMLPVSEQNDTANDIVPSDIEFEKFLTRNRNIANTFKIKVVAEDNEDMTGSYLMISPDGRFFNNVSSRHEYSEPILDVGVKKALNQTPLMREVFYKREGNYSCE